MCLLPNIIDNNNDPKSTYEPTIQETIDEQNIAIQNTLKKLTSEEDDLFHISMNVEIIKDSFLTSTSNHQSAYILNIATDLHHSEDHTNYTDEINGLFPNYSTSSILHQIEK